MKTYIKLACIVAMEEELQPLLNLPSITIQQQEKISDLITIYTLQQSNKNFVVITSGIGKCQASIATTLLLERYKIDYLLNFGTAGAFNPKLKVGDLILVDQVAYGDVDLTPFGYKFGQQSKQPAIFTTDSQLLEILDSLITFNGNKGLIVTCDSFISSEQQRNFILKHFPNIQALDMEIAAIAQVCHQFKQPFISLKGISDGANSSSDNDFVVNLNYASNQLALAISRLIEIFDLN